MRVWLFYSVVLVSTLKQSGTAMCAHKRLFLGSPSHVGPRRTLQSPRCATGGPRSWPILSMVSTMYTCPSQSPGSSQPFLVPISVHVFVLCVCLYFSFANKIIYTICLDSTHMCSLWDCFIGKSHRRILPLWIFLDKVFRDMARRELSPHIFNPTIP